MEIKGNIAGTCHVYMQNGSYTKYSFVSQSVTLTTEYQRFTFSNLTPAGPTAAWLANTPTDERAMLAMYTGYGSGRNPTVKNIQIELGAYATPFVESRLIDPYAQGYTARPVSVNLMIHGDVGTGTSFSDSSPSKHTVGGTASMAHSSAQSKFSGGSIYFPSADYLTATSSDFAFGTIDWTIDFWMNQSTTLGWASPVDTYGVAGHGFILGFDGSTNYLAFYSESGIGWANAYGSHAGTSFALTNGTWYHVAYVRNGNAFTCYVDGAVYFTATLSASDNFTSTGLYMGRRGNMNGSYEGYLDEVRVCRGTALYSRDFTPPTRRNRSAPVVDLSGSDTGGNFSTKDMTDVRTYNKGQVIEPVASAVWDFDGTDDRMKLPSQNDAQAPCAWGGFTGADNTNYSICMWVLSGGPKGSSSLDAPGLLARSNGDIYANLTIYNGVICFVHYNSSWLTNIIAISIEDSKWHHVAYVNTSSQIGTLYIDGVQQNYSQSSSISGSNYFSPDYIGYGYNNQYFLGKIAAAQVYQVALTSSQIKQTVNAQGPRFNTGIPQMVNSGLVVHLDSTNALSYPGSGTTWTDLSGNGNHGSLHNFTGPSAGSTSGFDTNTSWMMFDRHVGTSNGAYNNYVNIPNSASLDECLITNGVTVAYWFRQDTYYCTAMTKWNGSWEIYYCGTLVFRTQGTGGSDFGVGSSPTGGWEYIVCASDATSRSVYRNGVLQGTQTSTITSQDTSNPVSVGAYWNGMYAMMGSLPLYTLYNRKLSSAEVTQNFQADRERFGV
jgi:hypothetical protein